MPTRDADAHVYPQCHWKEHHKMDQLRLWYLEVNVEQWLEGTDFKALISACYAFPYTVTCDLKSVYQHTVSAVLHSSLHRK